MDVRRRPVKHQSLTTIVEITNLRRTFKTPPPAKSLRRPPTPTLPFSLLCSSPLCTSSLSAEYGEEKTQQSGAMIVEAVESSSGSIKKSKNGGLVSVSDPVQASRKGGASSLGGSPVVPSPSPEVLKNPSSPLSTAADGSKEPTASASPPPSTAMASSPLSRTPLLLYASRFLNFASRSSSLPSRRKQQPQPF